MVCLGPNEKLTKEYEKLVTQKDSNQRGLENTTDKKLLSQVGDNGFLETPEGFMDMEDEKLYNSKGKIIDSYHREKPEKRGLLYDIFHNLFGID